jgi:hypothetical protein
MDLRAAAAFAMLCVLAGCRPEFKPEGTLTVGGTPFLPVQCHALGTQLGIELVSDSGRKIRLVLPPARLDAFREIKGEPHFTAESPVGEPPVEREACATLMLRGEGYHGEGKRAVSGQLSLACEAAQGELTFSGCF